MHVGRKANNSDIKHARTLVGRGTLPREDALWLLARLEYVEVLVEHQATKCRGYKEAIRGLTRCVNKLKAKGYDENEKARDRERVVEVVA